MPNTWQTKLKDAERAFIRGDVDDARKLLDDSQVRRSPLGQQLTEKVVERIAERAEKHARLGDTTAGWRDLHDARALSPDAQQVNAAREEMIALALDDVEKFLTNRQSELALAKLDRLHQRNVAGGRVATMRRVVLKACRADRLCLVGKFNDAAHEWASAKSLRNDLNVLAEREADCRQQAGAESQLVSELKLAVTKQDWDDALQTADQILAMAPQHPIAREIREEAWVHVSENLTESQRLRRTSPWRRPNQARGARIEFDAPPHALPRTWAATGVGNCDNRRFQLWIDAVGGFLVCLGDEIEIGQALPGAAVDVPVFSNLAQRHARIRRDGEGYVLTPSAEVHISGRRLEGPSFLADGDEIQLGEGVRFRFRRPHALSASARLEPLSGHRTQPPADAVLLMAESLVLGPKLSNHVICRDWPSDVVLFRQGDAIHVRTSGSLEIDGKLYNNEGPLSGLVARRHSRFCL